MVQEIVPFQRKLHKVEQIIFKKQRGELSMLVQPTSSNKTFSNYHRFSMNRTTRFNLMGISTVFITKILK